LTDEELYEGFSKEQAERYRREARELYGEEVVEASEQRAKGMTKAEWNTMKDEGRRDARAGRAGRPRPVRPRRAGVDRPALRLGGGVLDSDAASYAGLGQLYTDNPEFRANYDRYRPAWPTSCARR